MRYLKEQGNRVFAMLSKPAEERESSDRLRADDVEIDDPSHA
jgi:hypothetical protein